MLNPQESKLTLDFYTFTRRVPPESGLSGYFLFIN